MQGIFGLFAYLGILEQFFVYFSENNRYSTELRAESANYAKPILAALLIAYFAQNLVLFDQLVSYAAFLLLSAIFYTFKNPLKLYQ